MHQQKIDDNLRSIAKGNVLSDDWSKKIYSVDASEFEILPSQLYKSRIKKIFPISANMLIITI